MQAAAFVCAEIRCSNRARYGRRGHRPCKALSLWPQSPPDKVRLAQKAHGRGQLRAGRFEEAGLVCLLLRELYSAMSHGQVWASVLALQPQACCCSSARGSCSLCAIYFDVSSCLTLSALEIHHENGKFSCNQPLQRELSTYLRSSRIIKF